MPSPSLSLTAPAWALGIGYNETFRVMKRVGAPCDVYMYWLSIGYALGPTHCTIGKQPKVHIVRAFSHRNFASLVDAEAVFGTTFFQL